MSIVDEISDKMTRDLFDAEVALRKEAEKKEADARAELMRVGTALCRDALSKVHSASPKGTTDWTARQLADLIIDSVGKVLDDVDLGQAGLGDLYRQAAVDVERLKRENAALASDIDVIRHTLQSAQNAQRTAEQTANDLRRRLAESGAGRKQLQTVTEQLRKQLAAAQTTSAIAAMPKSPAVTAQVVQPQTEARPAEIAKTNQKQQPQNSTYKADLR